MIVLKQSFSACCLDESSKLCAYHSEQHGWKMHSPRNCPMMPLPLLYLWLCNINKEPHHANRTGQVLTLTSNSRVDTDAPSSEYVLLKEISPPVSFRALLTAANTRAKWIVQFETRTQYLKWTYSCGLNFVACGTHPSRIVRECLTFFSF